MNLGLSTDDFEETERAFQKCFEIVTQHISAIEDFETFRTMMFARNTQLNLQALRQMEQERVLINHQKTQLTSNSDEAGSGHSNRGAQGASRDGQGRIVVTSEEEEEDVALKRAIEESQREAKQAAALEQVAKKLKATLPAMNNRPKNPAGVYEDINIEDDDLQELHEEIKESVTDRSARLKATRDALIL